MTKFQDSLQISFEKGLQDLKQQVETLGWYKCWDCGKICQPEELRVRSDNSLPMTAYGQLIMEGKTTFKVVAICEKCYWKW